MTLQDLENAVLLTLGMPSANPGGAPNWTQGEFTQNKVDWAINRAYARLVSDLGDLELLTAQYVFQTLSQRYAYFCPSPQVGLTQGAYVFLNVTGDVTPGQTMTVTINGVTVSYTTQLTDSMYSILVGFISALNASTLTDQATGILNPVNLPLSYQNTNSATGLTVNCYLAGLTGTATVTFNSGVGNTYLNAVMVAWLPLPKARMIRRVYYQSLGQTYRTELEPGARLISWEEFNRRTNAGYFLPNSAGTSPDFCAVSPQRNNLYFYPAPATTGDLVTVEYCPILTNSTTLSSSFYGYLVNPTDTPPLPEDAQDAIWFGAVSFLQPNAREYEGGRSYGALYKDEVQRIKDNYTRDSAGDALILRPVEDALATSGINSFVDLGGP